MDTLGLFGPSDSFRGSFWLFDSTKGVVGLGPTWESQRDAQQALQSFSELSLSFVDKPLTSNSAWRERGNYAVVTGTESGEVSSWAPVPKGWFPPGDPRR